VPVGQHVRVAGQELVQQRHQEVAAESLAHADLEAAGRRVVAQADAGDRALQRGQRAADLLQETFAAFGQRQASRAAVEQAHAKVSLEAADILADAGRGQAEHPRGRGEAAVLGGLDKGHQVLQMR
jgi:hypothetical protein